MCQELGDHGVALEVSRPRRALGPGKLRRLFPLRAVLCTPFGDYSSRVMKEPSRGAPTRKILDRELQFYKDEGQ